MQKVVAVVFVIMLLSISLFTIKFISADDPANDPIISNPSPVNESVDCNPLPTLSIDVEDPNGDNMNMTWYSNSSGSWLPFHNQVSNVDYSYGFESSESWGWETADGDNSTNEKVYGSYSRRLMNAISYLNHTVELENYTSLNLSYWVYPSSCELGDDLYLLFFDETGWHVIRTISGDGALEDTWTKFYDNISSEDYVFNNNCYIMWAFQIGTSDLFFMDAINLTMVHKGYIETGTQYTINANFSGYYTTYYWNVSVTDGVNTNVSPIYHFTTRDDAPSVTINFAGNLSESGGPYNLPPGESALAPDGYYTNDSRQSEDYIYINLSVIDLGSGVDEVWLHWLNETTWINDTYQFTYRGGNYWDFNTSGIISTMSGYNYSFDIFANDSTNTTTLVWWNKTAIGNNYTRRYVQLNCSPTTNISYQPYYFYDGTLYSIPSDTEAADRLHHDQGTDGAYNDTGYLHSLLNDDTNHTVYCSTFTGTWFDDSVCIVPFTLTNIYGHIWYAEKQLFEGQEMKFGWNKSGEHMLMGFRDYLNISNNQISHFDGTGLVPNYYNSTYSLACEYLQTTPTTFTENDIYELKVKIQGEFPSIVSNRSHTSWVLFNVPDNSTLNNTGGHEDFYDSDSDGLTDWIELYETYTSPFLNDTDNDGVTDYEETHASDYGYVNSDPNNYTNTTDYRADFVFSNEDPHNGSTDELPSFTWGINIENGEGNTFYWSINCSNGQTDETPGGGYTSSNGIKTLDLSGLSYSTEYMVWVNASDDGVDWRREWYTFTTRSNLPPVLSNENPLNGSIGQDLALTWNTTISDPDGDLFDWTIDCSNGQTNSANGDSNGSKTIALAGLAYSTVYTIWVNATDGFDWTREWFTFTTKAAPPANNAPSFSNEVPANGSTSQELSLIWSIDIADADGDTFAWTIECSNSDTNGSFINVDGTKNLTITGLSYLTVYTVWVNATDGTDSTSEWFLFTTKPFTPAAPTSLYAKTKSDVRIDISWTMGSGADKTYIVAKLSSAPTSRTDGTNIYNGTGAFFSHDALSANQHWYYRAYSWNDTYGMWSTLFESANTTTSPSEGTGGNGGNGGTTETPKPPTHEGGSSPIIQGAISLGIMFPIFIGAMTIALFLFLGKRKKKRKTTDVKKKAIEEYEDITKKTVDQRDRQRAYRLLDKQ